MIRYVKSSSKTFVRPPEEPINLEIKTKTRSLRLRLARDLFVTDKRETLLNENQ